MTAPQLSRIAPSPPRGKSQAGADPAACDRLRHLLCRLAQSRFENATVTLRLAGDPDPANDPAWFRHILEPQLRMALVGDAWQDVRFAGDERVRRTPGLRFLAAIRLLSALQGELGGLYLSAPEPRRVDDLDRQHLLDLAELFAEQIDASELRRHAEHEAERLRQNCQRLAQSEARYRGIFNTAVDVILTTDENGIIETINEAVDQMLGYRPEELIGESIDRLMTDRDRPHHQGHIERYRATGRNHILHLNREVMARHRNGHSVPIHIAVNEMRIGNRRLFAAVMHDISELHEIRRETETTATLLRTIIEDSRDPIFVKDLQGRYLLLNQACATAIGQSRETMLDHDDLIAFPPAIAQSLMETDRRVCSTGVALTLEEQIPGQDGVRSIPPARFRWSIRMATSAA